MHTITVTRTIPAPPEKVFDILADHANYKSFPGVKDSTLVKQGAKDRNGTGAVRRIETPAIWFVEEITDYERPRRFSYRITETSLPIRHESGTVACEPTPDGGTRVVWTTTLTLKAPVVGDFLTKLLLAPQLNKAFGSMLKETERRLAA